MNELLIEKPWWKRNLLWLLISAFIIGVLVFSSRMFLNGNLDFYALANADPSFYEAALDSANKNPVVVQKFGHLKPITNQEIYDGKAFYSNNKNTLKIILPVNGAKETGIMKMWLERQATGWKYDSVIIDNNQTRIIVIKNQASTADISLKQ
ncbi:cytochrome c oxidase assembly factor Coa1 family protein [Flavobacterium wongokense]|uniref:cytochrome c oxidase assembly factor Coa1 family protein n=1 Tax=Flavobacterium wongokense TaxID=2910674 RepID=UPI001F4315EC|nr:cytochrome c oxidase assembly factor Coa1 family protein [Flavobacterium sp. WG47]MCF6132469.1 cytochrome c oxidase assembly factor Coa1 family protein [Flavobacterium sp. WG47]